MGRVTLREVTQENVGSILRLKVAEEQSRFVADNAGSLAQAYVHPEAWPRAIYADEAPVGFVMLSIDPEGKPESPEYWIWRLMIGAEHQRQGYGRAAMAAIVEHVRGLPHATELKLSFVPEPGNPRPFYESLGFELTGEEEEGEKVMRLVL